tara:strand:- start:303 stop:965 length:663 start_codon:yes stop_codon:yes gene_type:complete
MSYFDPGYFKKKPVKSRKVIQRSVKNKFKAWQLSKEYYDGDRNNGYGGFKYDGRWLKILPKIIKKYKLKENAKILDLGCKKGFIMKDFKILLPNSEVWGIEDHIYPIRNSEKEIRSSIIKSNYYDIPFEDNYFDFTIGFSSIYRYNFYDLIRTINEIKRVSRKSFITLGAYSNEKNRVIFNKWSLLGTTILHQKEWIELFKLLKFKGDYYFTTANKLNLC